MFVGQFQFPIRLYYRGSLNGVPTNVYRISPSFFANTTDNPDNWCFHVDGSGKHSRTKEIPSGLFNASACLFGSPTYMSQPHFYQVIY